MSITIPVRDFKAHLSHYLARARAGEDIEITSHRKVIARVTGVPRTDSAGVARIVGCGEGRWTGGKPVGAEIRLSDGARSIAEMVLDDRR